MPRPKSNRIGDNDIPRLSAYYLGLAAIYATSTARELMRSAASGGGDDDDGRAEHPAEDDDGHDRLLRQIHRRRRLSALKITVIDPK